MKHVGILLALCTLLMTTGCGSLMNLTGISMLQNKELRPASVMGGVQTDADYVKHPPRTSNHPCDPLAVLLDLPFSLVADVGLLPITLPIAAIVGDGPFAPEANRPSPPKGEAEERPARRLGKGAR